MLSHSNMALNENTWLVQAHFCYGLLRKNADKLLLNLQKQNLRTYTRMMLDKNISISF
jgi:hypothetical protein